MVRRNLFCPQNSLFCPQNSLFCPHNSLYRPPGRLYFHCHTYIAKTKSICQWTFFTRRTTILKRKGKLLQIYQPTPTSTLTMAVSKAGLVYPRTAGHENDGDITWCKFVIGFPNPSTRSPEYNTFRKAMNRKMEQERSLGFVGSMADQ